MYTDAFTNTNLSLLQNSEIPLKDFVHWFCKCNTCYK